MLISLPKFLFSRARKRAFGELIYRANRFGVNLNIFYSCEGFKDQFGESPNKNIYINRALSEMEDKFKKGSPVQVSAIVDGGPRRDIVNYLIGLSDTYKTMKLDIFLLEAGRGWYTPLIDSYPERKFVAAESNIRADGSHYLSELTPPQSKCDELSGSGGLKRSLQTELWHWTDRA